MIVIEMNTCDSGLDYSQYRFRGKSHTDGDVSETLFSAFEQHDIFTLHDNGKKQTAFCGYKSRLQAYWPWFCICRYLKSLASVLWIEVPFIPIFYYSVLGIRRYQRGVDRELCTQSVVDQAYACISMGEPISQGCGK